MKSSASNLDPRYFNHNSTQSLIRISLTLSLAKTQGSLSSAKTQGYVYVSVKGRIVLNSFTLYTGKQN